MVLNHLTKLFETASNAPITRMTLISLKFHQDLIIKFIIIVSVIKSILISKHKPLSDGA